MNQTPIASDVVSRVINESGIETVGRASIREIKKIIDKIEALSGEKFIRMEMGIPGMPAAPIGVEAEIKALQKGVAAIYPDIQGLPELKKEISRFVRNYLDVEVSEEGCIPTVGSMQGSFATFLTVNRMQVGKGKTLFLDPGFPVHKQQIAILGMQADTFDVYDYRGEKLRAKLEEHLSKGDIASILYSNPNNPSWICFTDTELRIIADCAKKYNVVVIEDLAYLAMDFRKDYSVPGKPPYQPSVAKYYDRYVLLISSSKAFSYAGQRIGMMVISDTLFCEKAPDLKRFYKSDIFGNAMVFGTVYSLSSGTSHSAQYALAAMLKAANDGDFNFVEAVREYGEKAKIMKKMFLDNGFQIVYDKDDGEPIADGFYFTISYPGFSGEELIERFFYFGISAISLSITGSSRSEGLRACVSLIKREQLPLLESRLQQFHKQHPLN